MPKKIDIPAAKNSTSPIFGLHYPWLAPMAGYSDLPFRLLCAHFGAAVCETEMISAAGIKAENQDTADLLATSADEKRIVVQLFGADRDSIRLATARLREKGWLWFDLNLGCPAKKVVRQGAGSRLLENTSQIIEIAKGMIEEAGKTDESFVHPDITGKVGFKLRLGFEPGRKTCQEIALRLEDLGAAWITLHPRYGKQGFTGEADWREIEALARRLAIPLVASGDLLSAEKGLACMVQTGATGIMYARGALANPSIFQEHTALAKGHLPDTRTRAGLCETIKLHIKFCRRYYASARGFYKIRSILPRYARHHSGVGQFRQNLSHCNDWDTLINEVEEFMKY